MGITASTSTAAINGMLESKQNQIPSPKGMFQEILSEKLGTSQGASSTSQVVNTNQADASGYADLASYYGMKEFTDYISGKNSQLGTTKAGSYIAQLAADAKAGGITPKTTQYDQYIKKAAEEYGIPENLIKAVIQCESSFNPNAVSKSGAVGLMQLMPATAKSLGVTDSYNPEQNIMGGTKYLADLVKNFDGDYLLAMSGYNMGGNRVKKLGITPNSASASAYDSIPSGVMSYAKKVVETMAKYGG